MLCCLSSGLHCPSFLCIGCPSLQVCRERQRASQLLIVALITILDLFLSSLTAAGASFLSSPPVLRRAATRRYVWCLFFRPQQLARATGAVGDRCCG